MRKLATLFLASISMLSADPRGWRPRYYPAPRVIVRPAPVYYAPYYGPGYVIAGSVAAGIIGYELGRAQQPQTVIIQNSQPADACKTVQINNDQRKVCRDSQGNWQLMPVPQQ
jgi:hypothetical protein